MSSLGVVGFNQSVRIYGINWNYGWSIIMAWGGAVCLAISAILSYVLCCTNRSIEDQPVYHRNEGYESVM